MIDTEKLKEQTKLINASEKETCFLKICIGQQKKILR